MLAPHPKAKDFHHAHARNTSPGNEGPVYTSLAEASAANTGDNCYILDSSSDPLWFVVCGMTPEPFQNNEADLKRWIKDISIKGRINKDNM